MATGLVVFGPFKVPYDRVGAVKVIAHKHGTKFWKDPGVAALQLKQGCYFFAVKAGRNSTPWYVGQAKKGFKQETFTKHKRGRYNHALTHARHGTPVLFFVALSGTKRKVRKKEVNHMEKELIQDALAMNSMLCNTQHTKNLPRWTIRGVVRSGRGKPSKAAKSFAKMMGL